MKICALLILLISTTGLYAQWSGSYSGFANGDQIFMTLEQKGYSISGTMKDSYQNFDILGTVQDDELTGTATENSWQVEFELYATQTGDFLLCRLVYNVDGVNRESSFSLQKDGQNSTQTTEPIKPQAMLSAIPFPSGATFPASLAAKWTQNESYNSGSGDNFMGANFSQSMTFHSDGTLSEGGSSASMSGSNYSNQSSGSGSGKIDGIGWYAKQKNLYLIVYNEGNWTSVLLGTWYVENNHLLITGTSGEKLLLSK